MATKSPEGSVQLLRKEAVVAEIVEKLSGADAAVLTEYRGLTVSQIAQLRAALRPSGTEFKIFKNTLARRAAAEAGRDDLLPLLEGPVAIAFVKGDAVTAAKALAQFSKDVPTFAVKGGLLGGRVLRSDDVEALSKVPPREELLALMAGAFKAPMARAAGAFSGLQRKAAYALKALIDQRIAAGEAAPAEEAPAEEEEAPAAEEETAAEAEAPAAQDEAPAEEETPAAEDAPAE